MRRLRLFLGGYVPDLKVLSGVSIGNPSRLVATGYEPWSSLSASFVVFTLRLFLFACLWLSCVGLSLWMSCEHRGAAVMSLGTSLFIGIDSSETLEQ